MERVLTMGANTKNRIRVGLLVLAVFVLSSVVMPVSGQLVFAAGASASPKEMTMEKAVSLAIAEDSEIKTIMVRLTLQNMKLKEARQAVKDSRKNASTPRFTLPDKKESVGEHGLPVEIDLLMKVPTIEAEIADLNRKMPDLRLRAKTRAQIAFYQLLMAQDAMVFAQKKYDNAQNSVDGITQAVLDRKADIREITVAKAVLVKCEAEVNSTQLAFERKKNELGNIIGVDVRIGYAFQAVSGEPGFGLGFADMDRLNAHVLEQNYMLSTMRKSRVNAERKVFELSSVYEKRFGAVFSEVKNMLSASGGIDTAALTEKYEQMLEKIEEPWLGTYAIAVGLFTVEVPKEWFKGEYTAERYFGDQRYILLTAAIEREIARQEEEKAQSDLLIRMSDSMIAIKTLESACVDQGKLIEAARERYIQARSDNAKGKLPFADFEEARGQLMEAEKNLKDAYYNYRISVVTFNEDSSGFVDLYGSSGVTGAGSAGGTSGSAEAGSAGAGSAANAGNGSTAAAGSAYGGVPYWFIRTPVEGLLVEFGVWLQESLGFTHYTLAAETGEQIGGRTPATEVIRHLPLVFNGSVKMTLDLYQNDTRAARIEIDASLPDGAIDLSDAAAAGLHPGEQIGTWALSGRDGDFSGELAVTLRDGIVAEQYELLSVQGNPVSDRTDIRSGIKLIRALFEKTNDIEICFYTGGKPVFYAQFASGTDSGNMLKYLRAAV